MAGPLFTVAEAWGNGWAPAAAAGLATIVATRRVLAFLKQRQILDLPNERSSHKLPTPRGGGLATTPILAAITLALGWFHASAGLGMLGLGALVLLAISWADDRKGLPPLPRFLCHACMIAAFLALVPARMTLFGDLLPLWADRLAAGIAWLWFVNLYNFMDGIDGITGIETASLGLGVALAASVASGLTMLDIIPAGLAVAAIGAGFLVFNWHPAKVFLGDSGSIPLGYVLGGLLLLLAMQGQLAAALILPGYYLADATITLARRALNGEKVWQAHRKHFYQRAVQGGKRHDQVSLAILAGNVLLGGAGVAAASGRLWEGVAAAIIAVAGLLALLQFWSRSKAQ
jgi:UDP-N-acetylmuramyl pentapeptide phosphotransferase/UDP-N-acetylglucosamine-1-phosphate transferase